MRAAPPAALLGQRIEIAHQIGEDAPELLLISPAEELLAVTAYGSRATKAKTAAKRDVMTRRALDVEAGLKGA